MKSCALEQETFRLGQVTEEVGTVFLTVFENPMFKFLQFSCGAVPVLLSIQTFPDHVVSYPFTLYHKY